MAKMKFRATSDVGQNKKNLSRNVKLHKYLYKASVILNIIQVLTTLYVLYRR